MIVSLPIRNNNKKIIIDKMAGATMYSGVKFVSKSNIVGTVKKNTLVVNNAPNATFIMYTSSKSLYKPFSLHKHSLASKYSSVNLKAATTPRMIIIAVNGLYKTLHSPRAAQTINEPLVKPRVRIVSKVRSEVMNGYNGFRV